ncbi:DinB family protein [Bacillus sp. CGMCC 1.16607]|uniref:DinB family protein n=1 Tax=Bacillus sp. CGMCC 1.16607 TaxID=3351842 RepID=UPI00363FE635
MEKRPETNDFAPYYATYIKLVPSGEVRNILQLQFIESLHLLKGISEDQGHYRYGTDKWSIKEVIGHLTDTEQIMTYRLLCIARGETGDLPGYDDKVYVQNGLFEMQSMNDLIENWKVVRQSTLQLLNSLNEQAWNRRGNANGFEVTVNALAYIIAGHELHHRKILEERYLESEDYPL